MNSLAYILYLFITYLITVHVGLIFYRNGRLFILHLLNGDEALTDFISRILLAGYYLLNLGYAAVMINAWKTIYSFGEVLITVCKMTGTIMLTLAIIHFFNMAIIYWISKRKHHFYQHKN